MLRSLLIAPLLSSSMAMAEPLRLADVVERVAARGPESAAIAQGVEVARAEVTTARMFPNPILSILGARAEPVLSAGLAFRLPILGQRQAEIRAAEAQVASARVEASRLAWALRHAARVSYYGVALADEQVAIARAAAELADHVAQLSRQRFAAGAGTRLDQEQGALVRVRASQEVSDREAAAAVARFELARLLGARPEAIGPLVDGLATAGAVPQLDALLDRARREQPELMALAAERDAADARARSAKAARTPVPTLELGVDLLEPATCGGASRCASPRGGLGFDLPVFNLNAGPIARAQAESRLASLKLDAAALRVESALRSAHRRWEAAVARVRFFDDGYVAAAQSVEAMAREGFAAAT
jgi:outer membrane protein TolC